MTTEDSNHEDAYVHEEEAVKEPKLAKITGWLKTRNGKIIAIAAAAVVLVGGTATAGVIGAKVADENGSIGQFGHGPDGGSQDDDHFPGDHQPTKDLHGQPPQDQGSPYKQPGDADHAHEFGGPGDRPNQPRDGGDGKFTPPSDGQLAPTPSASPGTKS